MNNKKIFKINILNKLIDLGVGSVESFFPKNYSYSKWGREILGFDNTDKNAYLNKKELSSVLSQLKRDGLVQRSGSKMKSVWKATHEGKKYIQKAGKELFIQEDGVQRLVIFDIPEKDRKKRNWLRNKLISLKYKMLQKSVWIGYAPLPKRLMHEINLMRLQSHVYIFSVKSETE